MAQRGHAPSPELAEMRRMMDENAPVPDANDVDVSVEDANGVEVWRFSPTNAPVDLALIHFHGGGYRMGSPKGFRRYFARVARALGATIYAPKYSLAPDSAFPQAIDDGVIVYRWLLDQGFSAPRIVLGGDSAGGGVAAALLLKIAELPVESPAGVALFSAWLDLRVDADSFDSNAESDRLFSRERANSAAELYLQGHDAQDPLASPVLGNWSGQPPLLIQVSDIEVLRDDSLRLAQAATAAGVSVRLERFSDTQHVWHNNYPDTPQTVAAIDNWRDWLSRELDLLAPAPTPTVCA